MSREVVVVSAARTAIGTYGGSLKDTPPTELAALVVKETLARASVDGKDVGHVVFGHVVNTEPKDMYLSRVAAVNAGCQKETPAFNVNRLCGSGLQAIISASQAILLGDCEMAVGAGADDGDSGAVGSQRTAVGGGIDAEGEAADNAQPVSGQHPSEGLGGLQTLRGGIAAAVVADLVEHGARQQVSRRDGAGAFPLGNLPGDAFVP